MKQGSASNSGTGSRKVEPKAHAINPGGTNMLGNMQGSHVTSSTDSKYRGEKLYAGRGYEAPAVKSQSHNRGSQGRH